MTSTTASWSSHQSIRRELTDPATDICQRLRSNDARNGLLIRMNHRECEDGIMRATLRTRTDAGPQATGSLSGMEIMSFAIPWVLVGMLFAVCFVARRQITRPGVAGRRMVCPI